MSTNSPVLIVPQSSLTAADIVDLRIQANQAGQALARGSTAISDIIGRQQLRASDVNGAAINGIATALVGRLSNPNQWVQNVYATDQYKNFTTGQNQGFVITHLTFYSTPCFVDEVTIYVASLPVAVLPMEEVLAQPNNALARVGWLSDPVLVPPGTHCRMDFLTSVTEALGTEQYAIGGYVGEKQGDTVNVQVNNLAALVRQYSQGNIAPGVAVAA